MRRALLSLLLVGLAGCSLFSQSEGSGSAAGGVPFETKLTSGDDPRDIVIAVTHRGGTLEMVRESVRFAATRFCLTEFGRSDTNWVIDPVTGDWAHRFENAALVFQGRCTAR